MQESFEKLEVWQAGKDLCLLCYELTKDYPKEEQFALTNQIRRAAISVVSNIAESQSRFSVKDRAHFIQIAIGSVFELKAQFLISLELKYVNQDQLDQLDLDISRALQLVNGYLRFLKKDSND